LTDHEYEVCIDSSLVDGSLTYGECFLPGSVSDEVLVSCHVCHPSLCNDNLSGIALTTWLAKHISARRPHYSYRFLFIPGTIGSITWLSRNQHRIERIKHGLVLACVGDAGNVTYKRSRQGNAEIDQVVEHVLANADVPHRIVDFVPYGYDERQFCSPGFNLPVGCFMRTPHGEFAEYHTSADNLDFVRPEALADSLATCREIINVLETNRTYRNLQPYGEPQLGRRGLDHAFGDNSNTHQFRMALLWVLNLSDGKHTLLDIATRANMPYRLIRTAAQALRKAALLDESPFNTT
jgi:aminopeptidase-like protein